MQHSHFQETLWQNQLVTGLESSAWIYLKMVIRAQELNVLKAGTIGNIRFNDTTLTSPIIPYTLMIIPLAVGLGFVAGAGYVFPSTFMARGVQPVEENEEFEFSVYTNITKTWGGDCNG